MRLWSAVVTAGWIRRSFLHDRHHICHIRGFHRLVEVGEHHGSLAGLVIDRPHRKAKGIVMNNNPTCNRNEGNPVGQTTASQELPLCIGIRGALTFNLRGIDRN